MPFFRGLIGAGLLFGAILLPACQGGNAAAMLPPMASSQAGPAPGFVLGEYDFVLDPQTLSAALTPVARSGTAIGDTHLLDLGATLAPLCSDCFQVERIGLSAANEVLVDFALRHPFAAEFPRKQYEVFDVRAILLTPLGDAIFNDTPPGANGLLAANADLVPNADGYSTHYTERYPGVFASTLHPFKWFFREDDPDPVGIGAPIQNHRMAYGQRDVQRFAFVPPGTQPIVLRLVLEASYVEAANNALPPAQLGGSANPVFFLAEGHLDEAYRVEVALQGLPLIQNTVDQLIVEVTTSDWQQDALLDFGYPNLMNPAGLQGSLGLGQIAQITLEIPVILYFDDDAPVKSGFGTTANPRIDTWTVPFSTASVGRFPLLVSVVDQRQPATLLGLNSTQDLRAFRIAWLEVIPEP